MYNLFYKCAIHRGCWVMKRVVTSCMLAAFGLLFLLTQTGYSGEIFQNQQDSGYQIMYASPIGQTFTAEDSHILSIGFWVKDWNPIAGPIDLSIELFEGIGNTGTSLGSSPITGLAPGFNGFFYADFSFVHLTVGDIYTAIISSTSSRASVGSYDDPTSYPGGDMIKMGNIVDNADLTFRVIPEPATIALLSMGVLFLRKHGT